VVELGLKMRAEQTPIPWGLSIYRHGKTVTVGVGHFCWLWMSRGTAGRMMATILNSGSKFGKVSGSAVEFDSVGFAESFTVNMTYVAILAADKVFEGDAAAMSLWLAYSCSAVGRDFVFDQAGLEIKIGPGIPAMDRLIWMAEIANRQYYYDVADGSTPAAIRFESPAGFELAKRFIDDMVKADDDIHNARYDASIDRTVTGFLTEPEETSQRISGSLERQMDVCSAYARSGARRRPAFVEDGKTSEPGIKDLANKMLFGLDK
jgi:hypothetical protein